MARAARTKLGDLQLAIMRELWRRGEATVAEICAALREERGLALTTIATMLRKMEQKGIVTHRAEGRVYVYVPTVGERDVHVSMVGDLVSRLFGGDALALVNHLVDEGEIDRAELAELQRLIADRLRAERGGVARREES
jgi:predicted transcriptional regulator